MTHKAAVGIDLGTTFSCVAVVHNGKVEIVANDLGDRTTPSNVAFTETEYLVGKASRNQMAENPTNTLYDIKRIIGRHFDDESVTKEIKRWPFRVIKMANDGKIKIKVNYQNNEKLYSPEEISALVLSKMKETAENSLNDVISDVVITVPAYFNDLQRQATITAGTIAGLNVLRIINEPTAVALAYGVDKLIIGTKTILIFDFGGGTLDVTIATIVEGSDIQVKATSGDTHLGGADFDEKMKQHFMKEFQNKYKKDISGNSRSVRRLLTACEDAKIALSSRMEATVYVDALFEGNDFCSKFSRAAFEDLCEDLLTLILKPVETAIEIAKLGKDEIDHVILAGGSTRIPKVQKVLSEFFNGKQLNKSINPDEAIAYGAAVQAALLLGYSDDFLKDIKLVDVTPLTLGINVEGNLMEAIIDRCTSIPSKRTKTFCTTVDNQTVAGISIYEGERPMSEDNTYLGHISFFGIPPALRGEGKVNVTFEIDANGVLNVLVVEPITGNSSDLVIKNEKGRLSQQEIKQMLENAKLFKEEDKKSKARALARNNLEDYVYRFQRAANSAENKLSVSERNIILEACNTVKKWLTEKIQREIEEIDNKQKELKILCNSMLGNVTLN